MYSDFLMWLNRIGIILNFLAGFMLAPELIGIDNLRKTENIMELKLSGFRQYFIDRRYRLDNILNRVKKNGFANYFLSYQSFSVFWLITTVMYYRAFGRDLASFIFMGQDFSDFVFVVIVLDIIYLVVALISIRRVTARGVLVALALSTLMFVIFPILLVCMFVVLPVFIILLILFNLILYSLSVPVRFLSFIVNKLEGNNRLQRIVVGLGVVFFVTGNFLQFISTF